MKSQVYDSGDPNLPNLPDTDQILWSDYDDYLSGNVSDESYSTEQSSDHRENDHADRKSVKSLKSMKSVKTLKSNKSKKKPSNSGSFLSKINSRKSESHSRKSSGKSYEKRPNLTFVKDRNSIDYNNAILDSDDDSMDEKFNISNNHKQKRNQNQRSRKHSNTSIGNEADNSINSEQDNLHHSSRERTGSIFSMIRLPRLMTKTRRKSELLNSPSLQYHSKAKSNSSSKNNTPILQPTSAHSFAAGDSRNHRLHPSFSSLPPAAFDEELGDVDAESFYMDRDVSYNTNGVEITNNNDNDDENEDMGNISDDEHEDYDEEEEGDGAANNKNKINAGDNDGYEDNYYENHNFTDEKGDYFSDEHNNTPKAPNIIVSRIKSRNANPENLAHIEIDDKHPRKIMGTDTDYESDFNLPPNKYSFQPESILRKSRTRESGYSSNIPRKLNTNGSDADDEPDAIDENIEESVNNNDVDNDNEYDGGDDEDEENEEIQNENENDDENTQPKHKSKSKRRRAARRRKRRSRKYVGSQSKKERTAWEPGIDLTTTNVFLNSPGSIITVTDYSKTRYRISHYDLYSEMNPKYSKFSEDDTILSAHDFDEAYEEKSPEFNEYIEYMNKVSDSHYEVEEAIKNKPAWSQVRWINVNGLSWEAISIIGKKYNLHPLSVEDLVDIPQRTKMDIYHQHLFVVMPLLKLLKVRRYSDDNDETYFLRLRQKIRNYMNEDELDKTRGEQLKTSESNTRSTHSNSTTQSTPQPPAYVGPNSAGNGDSQPNSQSQSSSQDSNLKEIDTESTYPAPKIITKTIATKEQLRREFSRSSTKSQYPSQNLLQEKLDQRSNNPNFTQSGINDRILPRSSRTMKKSMDYNTVEEHKLAVEIERASPGRRLTDLTFIKPKTGRYKSRMDKIDKMRPLMSKSLAVGVEQVSVYLTSDGTVLSFFEHSAMEIERAILSRLSAEYTILRETCKSSILFHSILDANVDLLYPVVTAYTRILNEKEVEILTAVLPDLQHTQELHLMLNELAILKNSILPISSLITQLKDVSIDINSKFIDESCKLYLADIGDHLLAFIDEINSMSSTIENLIDLIFNTLSVETNNSMQQLSLVTVLFLPLTFWAGYFGMNFKIFGNLDYSVSFFWKLAIPFTACMMILVMRNSVWRALLRIMALFQNGWYHLQNMIYNNDDEKSSRFRRHNFDANKFKKFRRKSRKNE